MHINCNNNINFTANFNSPVLRFKPDDFFVPISGYGRNLEWADEVISIADTAAIMIRNNMPPECVLKYISGKMRNAASKTLDVCKTKLIGILRTNRENWGKIVVNKDAYLITPYGNQKYGSYKDRFNYVYAHPLKNPYNSDRFELTMPCKSDSTLYHGSNQCINDVLDYVFAMCGNIFKKFSHNDVKPENMKEVNDTMAEIRWVLAHSAPFKRGSDSITNVFMRAVYKALGIKTYPLKKGVSLDLEAFCTELSDYKRLFPKYFEKTPKIIE